MTYDQWFQPTSCRIVVSVQLKGWLPVDAVVVDGRPGLWWMDMSDVSLTEPFFQQTVERAKAENNQRGEQFTEFDVLLQLEKALDSVPPTGFIFHSSRCGSTLVANACRAITNSIVLSEANAIDKLVARFITDAPEGTVKESLYSVFLRGVVHALGQRRTGNEQHLFVKFACCSFAQIERITTHLAARALGFSLSRSGRNDRLEYEQRPAVAAGQRSTRAGVDHRRFTCMKSRRCGWKSCVRELSAAFFRPRIVSPAPTACWSITISCRFL